MKGQAGISPTTPLNYIPLGEEMHFQIESESHMVSTKQGVILQMVYELIEQNMTEMKGVLHKDNHNFDM